jgi:alpha-glucosidase
MRASIRRAVALAAGVLLGAGLLGSAPARADDASAWTVTGPSDLSAAHVDHGSSGPTATLHYDRTAGTVTLAVSRGGQTVLDAGSVGIVTEQADLSTGLKFLRRTDRRVVERYTTTVGKRIDREAVMTEARFAFAGAGGARLDLVVRVSRDGVAYRYDLPAGYGAIVKETSAFNPPATDAAWLGTYHVDYESVYAQTTAGAAATGEYETPALFESPGGYVLLAESDVDGRYSGSRLVHDAGTPGYRVKLWNDEKIQVAGALQTPWRTMIVGDLNTVTQSTLTDDLAPKSKIRDTGWIKPGSVFWSWLSGGREAGESEKIQKTYVDYAAAHGWPYILVDAGWYFDPNWLYDPTWEQTSWIPDLVRYAKARNVNVITWIHYNELDTPEEQAARLPLFEKWGVAGLKIDFMNSESQDVLRWYDRILAGAAQHHLMIDFHGSTIPKGTQRTWPNVVTMEGIYGAEHSGGLTAAHLTTVPFTRNVVGSMDYTPEDFQRPPTGRPTSDAWELGLSVIYESGIQNFSGSLDAYAARPEAQRFLDRVPTIWDETRLLAGRPGESSVFARRSGDRWFLGGGYTGPAHTAQVPLTLPRGRYLLETITDSPTGLVRKPQVVRAGDRLSIDVVNNGGFAGIACPWHPGITTCDKPVQAIPKSTVTVSRSTREVLPSASVTVSAQFTAADTQTDVTLAPRLPAGWTYTGRPAHTDRLRPGQTLSGSWTVTAPANPTVGYIDLLVDARFRTPDRHRYFENENVATVHVWRPLPAGWTYLSDLPITASTNGLGPVEKDTTNGRAAAGDGRGIAIRRGPYGKGLGTWAPAEVSFALGGTCTEFVADVGIDDEASLNIARSHTGGTVTFGVAGDGTALADSGMITTFDPAKTLDVNITGVSTLTLRVGDGGDGTTNDSASWGDARVKCG